jgi:peptidoglycan/xylan/chitin deacetylase (PgdA/CDA1 family)
MRDLAKQIFLRTLSFSGAMRIARAFSGSDLLALTYHRVVPRPPDVTDHPVNTLFADEFEQQMRFVARRYHVITGEELRAVLASEREMPRNALAITFDDGYENNYSCALPILREIGLRAFFFVTTNLIGHPERSLWFDRLDKLLAEVPVQAFLNAVGRLEPSLQRGSLRELRGQLKRLPNATQSRILDELERQFSVVAPAIADPGLCRLMTWEQVRSLQAAGMTIGSHTTNHQILSAAEAEAVRAEVTVSREHIERETGVPCWTFAYPNGQRADFREADERAVAEAGYSCAFTQMPGSISARTPRYCLPRIPVPDTGDIRAFEFHVSGLQHMLRGLIARSPVRVG